MTYDQASIAKSFKTDATLHCKLAQCDTLPLLVDQQDHSEPLYVVMYVTHQLV